MNDNVNENFNEDIIYDNHGQRKNISMDSVLESLPLVYNPSTKKLQVKINNSLSSDDNLLKSASEVTSYSNPESDHDSPGYLDKNKHIEESLSLLENCNNCHGYQEENEEEELQGSESQVNSACKDFLLHNSSKGSLCTNTLNVHVSISEPIPSLMADLPSLSSLDNEGSSRRLQNYDTIKETNQSKKRDGITDFFSRKFLLWKGKSETSCANCDADSECVSSSLQEGSKSLTFSNFFPHINSSKVDLEAGSFGLIMEGRPGSIPAKQADEEERHRQEYKDIVIAAKKREVKEMKERRKVQAAQLKQEKQLCDAVNYWKTVILPKWDAVCNQKKCQELWWAGIPSCVRGKVWKLAIKNDLNLTASLYSVLVQRSVEKLATMSKQGSMNDLQEEETDSGNHESTLDLISLDVSRTFPHLCIFQKGGPYHDPLHNILGAYVCYRPDIGYVQGMSFLAAMLLLNMEESDAFISFANLLNRPAHLAFFGVDQPVMMAYYHTFENLLKYNLPQLDNHLKTLSVTPDMYFLDWRLTVFSRSLPLDVTARIWDVYLRDGEEFLFKVAIGILKYYEENLLTQECTAQTAQFLTKLPTDLCCDSLFSIFLSIHTSHNSRSFSSLLDYYIKENLCETSY